jgi:NAD(P)H dehydrogenase (quinone)
MPPGYSHPALFKAGSPYGATFISQDDTQKPNRDDLSVARYQGERFAGIASRLFSALADAAT